MLANVQILFNKPADQLVKDTQCKIVIIRNLDPVTAESSRHSEQIEHQQKGQISKAGPNQR